VNCTEQVSGVLAAMGVREDNAFGTVRFSLGRDSVEQQVSSLLFFITLEPRGE